LLPSTHSIGGYHAHSGDYGNPEPMVKSTVTQAN